MRIFTVLKNFTNALTGTNPKGQLAFAGNTAYGVANFGGPGGSGMVFGLLLAPVINSQPQNLTVNSGNPASFSVGVMDEFPVTYQWYLNTTTLLGGQTASTLNLANVNSGNAGAYTVTVTDNAGSVTSTPAVLTVISTIPVITSQPQSLTVTNGNPSAFSVTATTSTGTLVYQWYFNTNTLISGQTNNTYTISPTFTNNAGYYTVAVGNGTGSITSNPALLTVATNSKPVISGQSPDQVVSSGDTVNIYVTASGLGPMHFQWYTNSVNTSIGNPSSIRTNAAFSFTCSTNNNHVYFTCIASNSLGKATSNPALLTVAGVPLIVTNPQPLSVAPGNTGSFSVVVFGPNLQFQWYSNSVNTAIGTPLTGQITNIYSFTAITNSNGKYYSVVVTNSFGRSTSSPALLSVVSLPTITLQPLGATITNGSSITFTSAAAGIGALGYQWLYQNTLLIPGATGTSLTFATANQPGNYSMKVTNAFGSATSTPALLNIVAKPTLLSSAFDPASGSCSFNFVNLAGSTNRLQVTTNLTDPSAWHAIATNFMATNGTWQFTDLNTARTNNMRLYRFSSP